MPRVFFQVPEPALKSLVIAAGATKKVEVNAHNGKIFLLTFAIPENVSLQIDRNSDPFFWVDNRCGSIKMFCVPFKSLEITIKNVGTSAASYYVGMIYEAV